MTVVQLGLPGEPAVIIPPFLSTHGNKAEIEHKTDSDSRRAKRRRSGARVQRCVTLTRIGWADELVRCRLEQGHKSPHHATRRTANRDKEGARRKRRLLLPVRRRMPSAQQPDEELRDRTMRDLTKVALIDGINATLLGTDGPPEALIHGHRRLLERSMGKLESCRTAQVIQELTCGIYVAIPFSCHVRMCPDCELLRQARFARIGEALVRDVGEKFCSFVVLTTVNPKFGDLERAKQRFRRDQVRMRRTPPFAGGPCKWPGHAETPGFNERGGHKPVPGGFSSDECPPSMRTHGTWNLHTNWILDSSPYMLRGELSWWWRRMTCTKHRQNCPGTCPCFKVEFDELTAHGVVITPSCEERCPQDDIRHCAGGAWDLWIQRLRPGKVREAVKYTTKPTDMVKAGAAAIVEFLIAMRGAKLINRWGSFRGRELVVDPIAQAEADAEMVDQMIGPNHTRKLFAICTYCHNPALYDPLTVKVVKRTELRLIGGHLMWRPPPRAPS